MIGRMFRMAWRQMRLRTGIPRAIRACMNGASRVSSRDARITRARIVTEMAAVVIAGSTR